MGEGGGAENFNFGGGFFFLGGGGGGRSFFALGGKSGHRIVTVTIDTTLVSLDKLVSLA